MKVIHKKHNRRKRTKTSTTITVSSYLSSFCFFCIQADFFFLFECVLKFCDCCLSNCIYSLSLNINLTIRLSSPRYPFLYSLFCLLLVIIITNSFTFFGAHQLAFFMKLRQTSRHTFIAFRCLTGKKLQQHYLSESFHDILKLIRKVDKIKPSSSSFHSLPTSQKC